MTFKLTEADRWCIRYHGCFLTHQKLGALAALSRDRGIRNGPNPKHKCPGCGRRLSEVGWAYWTGEPDTDR